MRKLLDWCDEAAVVHWDQEVSGLPTRQDAHRRGANHSGKPISGSTSAAKGNASLNKTIKQLNFGLVDSGHADPRRGFFLYATNTGRS
jgi:hypothetical protein